MSERDELCDELAHLSTEFSRLGMRLRIPQIVASELTLQQIKVLALVVQADPPLAAHEIAHLLGVTAATVSGIVARLVEAGLVEQVCSAEDRRTRPLVVTEPGARAINELGTLQQSHRHAAEERMNDEELRSLVIGMRAFIRALEESTRECGPPAAR